MFSLAGALTSLPYVALSVSTVVAAGLLWNGLVDNPSVRSEARSGYVTLAELGAAKAQLAETQRQAQAAQQANDNFAEVVRRQSQSIAAKLAEQEQKYAAYEERLKTLGRQCLLDDADIGELSR